MIYMPELCHSAKVHALVLGRYVAYNARPCATGFVMP